MNHCMKGIFPRNRNIVSVPGTFCSSINLGQKERLVQIIIHNVSKGFYPLYKRTCHVLNVKKLTVPAETDSPVIVLTSLNALTAIDSIQKQNAAC